MCNCSCDPRPSLSSITQLLMLSWAPEFATQQLTRWQHDLLLVGGGCKGTSPHMISIHSSRQAHTWPSVIAPPPG
jgi:hypothetical protein